MPRGDAIDTRQPITIERLLWFTYRDHAAAFLAEGRIDRIAIGRGLDSCVRVQRVGQLGLHVASTTEAAIHADAELVARAVDRVKDPAKRRLLIYHGMTASAPDWMPEAATYFEPARKPNGRPKMIYSEDELRDHAPTRVSLHAYPTRTIPKPVNGRAVPKRRQVNGKTAHNARLCLISEINPPSVINSARSEYRKWRRGLVDVFGDLEAERLVKFRLIAELPAARPWQTVW